MNLLLLQPDDLSTEGRESHHQQHGVRPAAPVTATVRIGGERLLHLRKVLRVNVGETVRTGLLNGPLGDATVLSIDRDVAELQIALDQAPPSALDVVVCLALPRPKFLGRVLQHVTTYGVKSIYLFQSARVEKSYWSSTVMTEASLKRHLCLGLEQARDTILPRLELLPKFRQLIQLVEESAAGPPDQLNDHQNSDNSHVLIADGGAAHQFPRRAPGPTTLVIGPEGGLVNHEIASLSAAGGQVVSLGDRPLRVETAVSACLSRLLP